MNQLSVLLSLILISASSADQLFSSQRAIATITDERLVEASGLEESYENPGYFWTHNDSGGEPVLYLIDRQGKVRMELELKGIRNRDWEEIVTVKEGSESFIYVAEIGDNNAVYDQLSLIKVREPKFEGKALVTVERRSIQMMNFQYMEGARDAEAVLYDQRFKEFVLVTKREKNCMVYSFPFKAGNNITIESKGTVPSRNFTAADMNEDGEILLKHYDAIYFWGKSDQRAVERILNWNPLEVDYVSEPQGEAICWSRKNFYTISEKNEGKPQEMLFFERMR